MTKVRLRKITADDVDFVDQQFASPQGAGELAWFGFSDRSFRDRVAKGETLTEQQGSLLVTSESGQPVGEVGYYRTMNGPPPHGFCLNMGIWIAPDQRGKGYGTAAQRAMVDYLFANTMYVRIEAGTEADNVAEQKALERAGFTREGVLRSACFRDGAYRDQVVYSILRHEL